MLRLPSSWVWDFWLADDGRVHHLYFLKASRALREPDRRHWRATIGHAVSDDLVSWVEREDALVPDEEGRWDDLATWTGSVVQDDDGQWRMFYTGVDRAGRGLVQRIGSAVSRDLDVWDRTALVLEADPGFYETVEQHAWPDQAWRDPWVYRAGPGKPWQMTITARSRTGEPDGRAVVGHATSPDLVSWTVQPPVSAGGAGFGQLEVTQVVEVEGRWVLLFSCLTPQLSRSRRAAGQRGGIWAVNAPGPDGPFDPSAAYLVADERLYVGRLVQDRGGDWQLLAFRNLDDAGGFVGEIIDPLPIGWQSGRLELRRERAA